MATFKLINNTASVLPLSNSSTIPPSGTRIVGQITLEMRRLEERKLLTIVKLPTELYPPDDKLLPDYIGTVDPDAGSNGGGSSGGSGGDLSSLTPAPDGSVPEWSTLTNLWTATTAPRNLVLDGGNF